MSPKSGRLPVPYQLTYQMGLIPI